MLQRVFVDSNVLVSRTTRDWLFLLRDEIKGMYQVHSTFDVLVEVARAWRRLRPKDDGSAASRLFEHLKSNLDELLDDFDCQIDFDGADPDDRHVHAAAVAANAHILLTSNERDFGNPDLLPYEIQNPDDFFCLVDDGAPDAVRAVALQQVKYWRSQSAAGKSSKTLVDALIDAGCPRFAERVQSHVQQLAGPSVRKAPDQSMRGRPSRSR